MGSRTGGTLAKPYEPQEIQDALLAFPARIRHLMPAWKDMPEEFRHGHGTWADFQHHWFINGLASDTAFHLKPGIDGQKALRHLQAIQGSYEPSHEEKVASVAFLSSQWFTKVVSGDNTWGVVPAETAEVSEA